MKMLAIVLLFAIAAYIAYEGVRMWRLIGVSSTLVHAAHAYTNATGTRAMLVLGDSTAVGVGSSATSSVPGRLGVYLDAAVENYAVSGATVDDLAAQMSQAKHDHYDVVLIQIGANDIIRFHSIDKTNDALKRSLDVLRQKSDHILLLTAGKVGEAPFFPRLLGWLWTQQAKRLRAAFMASASASGVVYVDLYNAPDPFSSDPERYYAPDGLHLTADGYGFWYDEVKKSLGAAWPEFAHD